MSNQVQQLESMLKQLIAEAKPAPRATLPIADLQAILAAKNVDTEAGDEEGDGESRQS